MIHERQSPLTPSTRTSASCSSTYRPINTPRTPSFADPVTSLTDVSSRNSAGSATDPGPAGGSMLAVSQYGATRLAPLTQPVSLGGPTGNIPDSARRVPVHLATPRSADTAVACLPMEEHPLKRFVAALFLV